MAQIRTIENLSYPPGIGKHLFDRCEECMHTLELRKRSIQYT